MTSVRQGVLLLNKDQGVSSNTALQQVKRFLGIAKAGHTGTLDPLATGMLPICIGEATKFAQYFLMSHKRYLVTARFGQKTSTGDAEGEVLGSEWPPQLSLAQINQALATFQGKQWQKPPMFSALKVNGQRLYKLARKGLTVDRPCRAVEILQLSVISYHHPELTFAVTCGKGTYMRTLVEDLASKLGTMGYMKALHRLQVGELPEEKMHAISELKDLKIQRGGAVIDQLIVPVDVLLNKWPALHLDSELSRRILVGQRFLYNADISTGLVRLFNQQGRFLGLGEYEADGLLRPKRLMRLVGEAETR